MTKYDLYLNIVCAVGLKEDMMGSLDPFVEFKTSPTETYTTRVYPHSTVPFWDQEFNVQAEAGQEITFYIKNDRSIQKTESAFAKFTVPAALEEGAFERFQLPITEKGTLIVTLLCNGVSD